jgi:UDP-N-acetylmuramate dehydrogenase
MDLTSHNTLGLSCKAQRVMTISSLEQLPAVSALARQSRKTLVLGGGSNVVLPAELDDLVLRVALKGIHCLNLDADSVAGEFAHAWCVEVAAGENWHDWVVTATKNGWAGLENLALIPGTVGAAPVQNIGAYGVELQDRIASVTAWHIPEGRMVTLSKSDCAFAYRDSLFKRSAPGTWLIVSVRFLLPKQWQAVLNYPDLRSHPLLQQKPQLVSAQEVMQAVCEIRQRKLPDPAVLGNAGSFFKNPVVEAPVFERLKEKFADLVAYAQADGTFKLAAGWLIERSGWKGRRVGAVGVHDRQALVLVNYGGAQAEELLALSHAISETVRAQFGVALEIEPVVVAPAN